MLTRSYLTDITLVGLASFTLLCVFGKTCGRGAGVTADRHAFAVEIALPDGQKPTYRVDETRQTADQLRADLVQQISGRRTPDVARMQWFQETAERYAALCCEPEVSPVSQDADSGSVFRTVSTGLKSSGSGDNETQQLTRWREFWTQRQTRATDWLAKYEVDRQTRQAALNASIQITPVRSWLPPASVCVKAALVAVLVMLLGAVWRLVSPPGSCHGLVRAGAPPSATPGNPAAMCFRESWVRVRQPVNVVVRGVAGWAIVLSSLVVLISVAMCSLVS